MAEKDPGTDTRLVEIAGRQVVVKMLNETQLLLIAREADMVGREGLAPMKRITAAGRIMRVLEAAIVQDSDREHIQEEMIKGNVDLGDMLNTLKAFAEDKPTNRAVRRATKAR